MVSSSEGRAAQVEGWGTGSKKQTQGKHGETETNKQTKKEGSGGKTLPRASEYESICVA